MTLHAQGQRFQSLQQDEGIERGDGGAGITQNDRTDTGDEGCRTCHIGKDGAVIAGVRLCQRGELVRIGFPRECTAVHNDTTQAGVVAADEFGG